jgi:hypothetical protein
VRARCMLDRARRHGVRSACDSERPTTGAHGQSWSLDNCMPERAQSAFTLIRALENNPKSVVRGGVEPELRKRTSLTSETALGERCEIEASTVQ